jgi:hypothetical protein
LWRCCGVILFLSAISEQSRLLPQRHDPTRPALDCFLEGNPRHPVITGKGDQLFDVRVVVVPKFNCIRKIKARPIVMQHERQNANAVKVRSRFGH